MKHVIEASYPVAFRASDGAELGSHIARHQSVDLVGMKRVGISNFLRYFLYHEGIVASYIKSAETQLFVHIDLNDLVERNISAFWTLLLTRLVDGVQQSEIPEQEKRLCRRLFVQSIQLKDQFFTLDSIRKVLVSLHDAGLSPTLFFLRFDRLSDAATPEFVANLFGLRDAVKQKLSYVFTSFRPLSDLAPDVFTKRALSTFVSTMYLKPASADDMQSIVKTLEEQYHTALDSKLVDMLIDLTGGYVQYLQLAIVRLTQEKTLPATQKELFELLSKDEQVQFQSEELFESLTKKEKDLLLSIQQGNPVSAQDRETGAYLWNTGMVVEEGKKPCCFSPLFDHYVGSFSLLSSNAKEFTKKEHQLFTFLKEHEDELCERDAIIKAVWPETHELGVSDWAIDRLVARLRGKLKSINSDYQIVTVVTRGYKMTKV